MPADTISIIITILNGAKWIDKCMQSICKQTAIQQQRQRQQQQRSTIAEQQQLMSLAVTSPAQKKIIRDYHNNENDDNNLNELSDGNKNGSDNTTTTAEIRKLTTTNELHIEICVFDDCSNDETLEILKAWQNKFENAQMLRMRVMRNESGKPKGVGYGRNMAIAMSTGNYLCFQDIDDEMLPHRILKQYALAKRHKDAIIGSKFIRYPVNSTCRFSRWANELSAEKLSLQIYTSNGPTVIMPTWFCHRNVYDKIKRAGAAEGGGGFCEDGKGTPEDLIFFYKHLDAGGSIFRVDECLLRYHYHAEATTFSVTAKTIWHIRLQYLIEKILTSEPWQQGFTIWNAGKQGRKFFRDLPLHVKNKVLNFCDVDKNKICKYYKYFDVLQRKITHTIPIVHFSDAKTPLLICMKLDMTKGAFEANLKSLNLTEGKDYVLFT